MTHASSSPSRTARTRDLRSRSTRSIPSTGLAYDWQYDAVQAGPAIAAVGGGSSTIVAVVDSGVDVAQPDLAGRLLPGYDATRGDGTVFDSVGHGTFVAGLISMVDGNGIGAKGVAGATRVLPVRASVDGSFTDDATVRGITWAADNGAGVINLSLGGPGDDPALDRAIDYATAKGALVVASAGNSGNDPGNPVDYPAAYVGGPTRERRVEHRPLGRSDDTGQPARVLLDAQPVRVGGRARRRPEPGGLRARRLLHHSGQHEHDRVGRCVRLL